MCQVVCKSSILRSHCQIFYCLTIKDEIIDAKKIYTILKKTKKQKKKPDLKKKKICVNEDDLWRFSDGLFVFSLVLY